MYDFNRLKTKWEQVIFKIKENDGCIHELTIENPASLDEITAKENELNVNLPSSYKMALSQFSKSLHFYWSFSDETIVPNDFREIFSGSIHWNIDDLEDLTKVADEFLKQDGEDWAFNLRNKIGFAHSGNGDIYAFDMNAHGEDKPVVYWEHEEDKVTYLADSFIDFLEKITELHCIGDEIWQFEYFINENGLNTESELAVKWKTWFENFTQTKLEYVKHDIGSLIDYVLYHGNISEDTKEVFLNFDKQDIFDSVLIRLNEVNDHEKKALYFIIGELLGEFASDWVRSLWSIERVDSRILAYLSSRCLKHNEGLKLTYAYLENNCPDKINGYDAYYHLHHFSNANVIDWMKVHVRFPVTEGWDSLYATSKPSWNSIKEWLSLEKEHETTIIHALDKMIEHDDCKIKDAPSRNEFLNTLTSLRDRQILKKKKEILDNVIDNINRFI